jgi:hypothetical protein
MTLDAQSEFVQCERSATPPPIAIPGVKSKRIERTGERKRPALAFVKNNPPVPSNDITDYDSLHAVLRARAEALAISRATIDHISGLQDGFSAKILSPNKLRSVTIRSLGPLLSTLALKLVAVPDDEAFARNRSRYVRRDESHYVSARKRHDGRKFKRISGAISARFFGWPS